jgi:hypothetical protein
VNRLAASFRKFDVSAHLNPKALLGSEYGEGTILEMISRAAFPRAIAPWAGEWRHAPS